MNQYENTVSNSINPINPIHQSRPAETKKSEPKTFSTINAAALMAQEFEPLQFAVDKILPHGLFILAGSGKIGKSWLALEMCTAVSSGGKLWDFAAAQGEVLYLALEDTHARLQARLKIMEAENEKNTRLHLGTASLGISSGMLEQTHNFLKEYPDTKLIIVDTLERIRDTEQDKSMYSCDYRDMTTLREITNRHHLTLLLIHHTRKMYDPDPLNTLSGSTGLIGSVDGVFVLEKEKRIGNKAKLTIANRDTEGFCFKLEFDPEKCKWLFDGNDTDAPDKDEPLCQSINGFLKDSWKGTATELCAELKAADESFDGMPADVSKRLKALEGFFKNEMGIGIEFVRTHQDKVITLTRNGGETGETERE